MNTNIMPNSLSDKDKTFVYLLAKEKVISRLSNQYIQAMNEKNKEIAALNKKLNKRVTIDPQYLTTRDAAVYIGTDSSFLTKRQGKSFKLGKHFFKPKGESIVRWDIQALSEWITTPYDGKVIDEKLASLIKRR